MRGGDPSNDIFSEEGGGGCFRRFSLSTHQVAQLNTDCFYETASIKTQLGRSTFQVNCPLRWLNGR